jgi:hypothetical protein
MQLEPRDILVLIREEAERLGRFSSTGRRDDLEGLRKHVAKLTLLLEALEAACIKR